MQNPKEIALVGAYIHAQAFSNRSYVVCEVSSVACHNVVLFEYYVKLEQSNSHKSFYELYARTPLSDKQTVPSLNPL